MDWNNVAIELLENILIFTASPQSVAKACMTCKNWSAVNLDVHFWKSLYYSMSPKQLHEDSTVDWKTKVCDLVLVRKNIQNGRCVVRTVAAAKNPDNRSLLEFDNYTLYKDHCLVNWQTVENYGSYGGIYRTNSNLFNMVTGEANTLSIQNILFANHYIAKTPSGYYGGANFSTVRVLDFEGISTPDEISFADDTPGPNIVKFMMPEEFRNLIPNFCPSSNFVGFWSQNTGPGLGLLSVVDGTTGEVIWSQKEGPKNGYKISQMFDKYLAISRSNNVLEIVDVTTKELKQSKFKNTFALGFMEDTTIALRTDDKILLWNFKTDEVTQYPAGSMPMCSITMIYHGMWLVYSDAKLAFYDMKDGSLINTVALRTCNSNKISLLSDGRLAIAQSKACHVLSFVDSEVNRVIKVEVLAENGTRTTHNIPAHDLVQFFARELKIGIEKITSQIIKKDQNEQEQTVLIFAQVSANQSKTNEPATDLLRVGKQAAPPHLNTPYLPWTFDSVSIPTSNFAAEKVWGKAVIVHERKIDGRWQLV